MTEAVSSRNEFAILFREIKLLLNAIDGSVRRDRPVGELADLMLIE